MSRATTVTVRTKLTPNLLVRWMDRPARLGGGSFGSRDMESRGFQERISQIEWADSERECVELLIIRRTAEPHDSARGDEGRFSTNYRENELNMSRSCIFTVSSQ